MPRPGFPTHQDLSQTCTWGFPASPELPLCLLSQQPPWKEGVRFLLASPLALALPLPPFITGKKKNPRKMTNINSA